MHKIKRKIELLKAFFCIFLMMVISVSAVVTIDETSLTTDDSSFKFDFDDNWIDIGNMTVDNVSAGNVTVSGDFIGGNVANWDTAYGWGDHSLVGYLTAYGDPWFNDSIAYRLQQTWMDNWNTSYTERGSQIAGGNITWDGTQLNTIYNNITMIHNNNDNYWTATGANIQLAIDDLSGENGTVYLAGNTDYTTTTTINLSYNCTLDLGYSTIYPNGDFDVVLLWEQAKLQNGVIDISKVAMYSNTSAAIRVHMQVSGSEPAWMDNSPFRQPKQESVENVGIIGKKEVNRGIGLSFLADDDGESNAAGYYNNLYLMHLHKGIALELSADGTYINANNFNTIRGVACTYFIYLDESAIYTAPSGEEIAQNTFENIWYEAESYATEYYPIFLNGTHCHWNHVRGVAFMDWLTQGDTTEYIRLNTSGCDGNYFSGGINKDYVVDNGDDNVFYGISDLIMEDGYIFAGDVNSTDYNTNVNTATGVRWFYTTTGNPKFVITGYDAGAAYIRLLQMYVNSAGTAIINSYIAEDMHIGTQSGVGSGILHLQYDAEGDVRLFYNIKEGEDGSPSLRIYGEPSASGNQANEYLQLGWNGTGYPDGGYITTSSGGGDLNLSSDNDKVTIDDVLNIKPQAGPPANPVEGDIYYELTNHTACCYNGASWKAFW